MSILKMITGRNGGTETGPLRSCRGISHTPITFKAEAFLKAISHPH